MKIPQLKDWIVILYIATFFWLCPFRASSAGHGQAVPSKAENALECEISVTGKTFALGSKITVELVLRNKSGSPIQIPMPYSNTTVIRAFILAYGNESVTRRIPVQHELVATLPENGLPPSYATLKPNEGKTFKVLVGTLFKNGDDKGQETSLPPGHYGLEFEIESLSGSFVDGHVKWKRLLGLSPEAEKKALVEQEVKVNKDPPELIDPEILWRGRAHSNLETLTLK